MKHLLIIAIVFSLVCLAVGCSTLGTADRATMMQKWRGEKVDVELLADINAYGNYTKKGNPLEPGKCVDQAEYKASILKELGVPYTFWHCEVTRNNPWRPTGHRFLTAQLNGKEYIMDNGTVQDVVWEFEAVKGSTSGVINYQVEE